MRCSDSVRCSDRILIKVSEWQGHVEGRVAMASTNPRTTQKITAILAPTEGIKVVRKIDLTSMITVKLRYQYGTVTPLPQCGVSPLRIVIQRGSSVKCQPKIAS